MPFWASALISFAVRLVTQWLASLRAEQALRDLGAATERDRARQAAEAAEQKAREAGDAAADGPDNPRDLRPD